MAIARLWLLKFPNCKCMNRILSIILFIVQGNQFVVAQNGMPPVYEIATDTPTVTIMPDSCWQMLEDSEGRWTIDDVNEAAQATKFHNNTGYDYSINTYWFRYRLKNKMDHDARIYFRSLAPIHDIFTRTSDDTDWQHQKTGWLIPWSKREGMKGIQATSLVIPAGKELIIYRRTEYNFKINRPGTLRIGILFIDPLLDNSYIDSEGDILQKFLFAINFGLFLLTAILSYFFYQITHEKVFIRGALGYFFLSLAFLASIIFVIFKEHPFIIQSVWRLLDSSIFFVTVFVVRSFLNIKERFPVWDKILILSSLLPLLDLA